MIEPKRLGDEDVYGTWLNEIKPEELKIEDKSQKDLQEPESAADKEIRLLQHYYFDHQYAALMIAFM